MSLCKRAKHFKTVGLRDARAQHGSLVVSETVVRPSSEVTEKEKRTDIGGGAWLFQFRGCNAAINKIRAVRFRAQRARGSVLDYFWIVDGAWNFYKFQEKPAAPVVYGVLSIARERFVARGIAFTG